jgi:5-methylcytosine-specific restriction endonuclease McrA
MEMEENTKIIIEQFVDCLLPDLTPSETSLNHYLLCNSFVKNNSFEVRVGKRTIATKYGKGSRGEKTNYEHVSKTLKMLEGKGCIKIKDTNREGTLYIVNLPKDIPLVAEKIASLIPHDTEEDYFNDPEKRREIFERDKWICQYCGEKITQENATLDHYVPQRKGDRNNKENLKTCCLLCNSIKSGKAYEEATALLLKSIQERKAKSHMQY